MKEYSQYWSSLRFLVFLGVSMGLLVFNVSSVLATPQTLQLEWGSFDAGGSTDFGVYDEDNMTILEQDDVVQLIWAGPDGEIDPPNLDGTPSDDDEQLATNTICNDCGFSSQQNKGYVFLSIYSFNPDVPGNPPAGGTIYIRAWNAASPGSPAKYGDSVTSTLENGGTFNAPRWHIDTALPVELATFEAIAVDKSGAVQVIWETATEWDHAGFNVYRSHLPNLDAVAEGGFQVNEVLIAAQGTLGQGASYSLNEDSVPTGVWYYFLEDVDIYGASTLHGPVKVDLSAPTSAAFSSFAGSTVSDASVWVPLLVAGLLFGAAAWERRRSV